MEAFGIFEGGGAKGLAHIGALKATEEAGVEFIGVAGTSAGSIVASLVAAGYRADELYNTESQSGIFYTNFLDLLDELEWKNLKDLRKSMKQILVGQKSNFQLWRSISWFLWRNSKKLQAPVQAGGFLGTDKFRKWLDQQLIAKLSSLKPNLRPSGENGAVAFQDLDKPLKVIAADVRGRKLRVYSMPTDAKLGVAAAVCASISIPFVFKPASLANQFLVDGGIMSNFPAWVFDIERRKAPPLTPTFGFRLVEKSRAEGKQNSKTTKEFSMLTHISDVFQTAVFGDNTLEKREVSTLHEIPLAVRIGPLDFEVSSDVKDDVYRDGKNDARDYFQNNTSAWRKPQELMDGRMGVAYNAIHAALGHPKHLRMNIMLPITNEELQVVYAYKMDDDLDCDDRLAFRRGSGACGLCWETLDYVICDLVDAANSYRDLWKMDKYQQRLVRADLRSLLCVPMFDQSRIRTAGEDEDLLRKSFIGVLNIDSDDIILDKMRELVSADDKIVRSCAAMLSDSLTTIGR
jgi:NTE family protein